VPMSVPRFGRAAAENDCAGRQTDRTGSQNARGS